MITMHGFGFNEIDKFWFNLRHFFYSHKTFFDIFFLGIYTVEQLSLILLTISFPQDAALFAGLFALVFITTISLERICMESRYTYLRDNVMILTLENNAMSEAYETIAGHYKQLVATKKTEDI